MSFIRTLSKIAREARNVRNTVNTLNNGIKSEFASSLDKVASVATTLSTVSGNIEAYNKINNATTQSIKDVVTGAIVGALKDKVSSASFAMTSLPSKGSVDGISSFFSSVVSSQGQDLNVIKQLSKSINLSNRIPGRYDKPGANLITSIIRIDRDAGDAQRNIVRAADGVIKTIGGKVATPFGILTDANNAPTLVNGIVTAIANDNVSIKNLVPTITALPAVSGALTAEASKFMSSAFPGLDKVAQVKLYNAIPDIKNAMSDLGSVPNLSKVIANQAFLATGGNSNSTLTKYAGLLSTIASAVSDIQNISVSQAASAISNPANVALALVNVYATTKDQDNSPLNPVTKTIVPALRPNPNTQLSTSTVTGALAMYRSALALLRPVKGIYNLPGGGTTTLTLASILIQLPVFNGTGFNALDAGVDPVIATDFANFCLVGNRFPTVNTAMKLVLPSSYVVAVPHQTTVDTPTVTTAVMGFPNTFKYLSNTVTQPRLLNFLQNHNNEPISITNTELNTVICNGLSYKVNDSSYDYLKGYDRMLSKLSTGIVIEEATLIAFFNTALAATSSVSGTSYAFNAVTYNVDIFQYSIPFINGYLDAVTSIDFSSFKTDDVTVSTKTISFPLVKKVTTTTKTDYVSIYHTPYKYRYVDAFNIQHDLLIGGYKNQFNFINSNSEKIAVIRKNLNIEVVPPAAFSFDPNDPKDAAAIAALGNGISTIDLSQQFTDTANANRDDATSISYVKFWLPAGTTELTLAVNSNSSDMVVALAAADVPSTKITAVPAKDPTSAVKGGTTGTTTSTTSTPVPSTQKDTYVSTSVDSKVVSFLNKFSIQ